MRDKFFKGNLITALISQVISTSAGMTISFILPKFLGVEQYGFWQLFLFYVAYVNILAFGVFEGLYLKHGGEKYEQLDYKLVGTEWKVYVVIQFIFALIICIVVLELNITEDRRFVLLCCCICIPIINSNDFLGRILQSVNRTKLFSFSVIIYNLLWFVAVVIVAVGNVYSYKVIVVMYTLGHICAGIYLMMHTKKIIFATKCSIDTVIFDIKDNIRIGLKLFVAGYASSLIIGSARILVDNLCGIEVFGKVSFSLSITYFFLRFINQVSIVMFPALRQINTAYLSDVFNKVSDGLDIILPAILLGYVPLKLALSAWLPQYSESMTYLVFLLPVAIFDGKMQLLFDTYYKVLRKEKELMILNVSTMLFSIIITTNLMIFFNDVRIVLFGILIALIMRSFRAYAYLSRMFNARISSIYQIILLVMLFVVITNLICNELISFIIYFAFYLAFLIVNKEKANDVFTLLKNFFITKGEHL